MKKIISTLSAAAIAVSVCAPMAYAEYDADGGYYNIGSGFMVTAAQLYENGFEQIGSNPRYDTRDDKKGTITFSAEDERSETVADIFGETLTYEGVIDYVGRTGAPLTFTVNAEEEGNYFTFILATSSNTVNLGVDGGAYVNPTFAVEGDGGVAYAVDCGVLTAGEHTITIDGTSSTWCPDIAAVAVYPMDGSRFILPYQNESLTFEERAADLVARMTLEEKISQLGYNTPAIARLGVSSYYYWREAAHGVARQGKAASFPVSLAMSNTWDVELYRQVAEVTSTEARAKNSRYDLNYWSPTINMARDPRWGRNEESLGEDTYLTTQLGSAFVEGMQGEDEKYLKTIATVKHFLANNCESERQRGTSAMTESELRDYYARAFQNIVEESEPGAVMSSYNATTVTRNGEKLWDYIPMAANENILTDMLRRNWGFNGFVTADCGAVANLNGNAFKRSMFDALGDSRPLSSIAQSETVALSIEAGNEMDCGNVNTAYGVEAVENGYLSEDELDIAVFRIFLQRFRTGEFDDTTTFRTYTEEDIETAENVALAERAAEESWVLLKNDGILPVSKDVKKAAVVGSFADKLVLGDYTGSPEDTVTPIEGITEELGKNGAEVELVGSVSETTPLYNVRSIKLVRSNGSETELDLSAAEIDGGMTYEDGILKNVTQQADAVIRDVDFSGVTAVRVEMATGTLYGGSFNITYGQGGPQVASIASQPTADENTFVICESAYTGDDGGYNETADMYISASAEIKDFAVEDYRTQLDEADIIIAYAATIPKQEGLGEQDASESHDRDTIDLPEHESHVQALCDAYPEKTVVAMSTSGQINVDPFEDKCRAILWTSYNGQRQGTALGKVLSGEVNPSGKLSTTWYDPADLEIMTVDGTRTTSVDTNGTTEIVWETGDYSLPQKRENDRLIWPGRTYMYYGGEPQYPFGYGLSYTDYTYSDLKVDKTDVSAGSTLKVSVDVTNSGNGGASEAKAVLTPTETGTARAYVAGYSGDVLSSLSIGDELNVTEGEQVEISAPAGSKVMLWDEDMKPMAEAASASGAAVDGTEIVQIYASHENGDGAELPLQQLVGFARVELAAGETKTVEVEIDTNDLARWSETEIKKYVPAGNYTIYAGKNVTDRANSAEITISGVLPSTLKTVYAVPTGITVTGAYSSETNTTAAIKTVSPQLSAVMTDETEYDIADAEVEYTSSDPEVASAAADGTVSAGIKEGVATITASVTVDGVTKSASFPVVCKLQDAIPSSVRAEYIAALEEEFGKYSEENYREDHWAELEAIYAEAHTAIENEVDADALDGILNTAKTEMAAVRDHLRDGEYAYTLVITPDWYRNADITISYNGDEDAPQADVIVSVNGEETAYTAEASMDADQTIRIEDLEYGDVIEVWAVNGSEILSERMSDEIEKPPAHVVYDLSDPQYERLGAVASGEPIEEVNGFGGYGSFTTISDVNYRVEYNGTDYTLTGGFQGGKGNTLQSNVYFRPFDCYAKATVTVFFDSASNDREMRIAQADGTRDGKELGRMGGDGNRNIQTLTVTTEDMDNLIYIQPQTKESFYMIVVDYEGERTPETEEPPAPPTELPPQEGDIELEFESYEKAWTERENFGPAEDEAASGGVCVEKTHDNDLFYFGLHNLTGLEAAEIVAGVRDTAGDVTASFYALEQGTYDADSDTKEELLALLDGGTLLGSAGPLTAVPDTWSDFRSNAAEIAAAPEGTYGLFVLLNTTGSYCGNIDLIKLRYME